MRRHILKDSVVLVGAALLALAPFGTTSATASSGPPTPGYGHARILATFPSGPAGAFAESMASDGHGGLIVSVTTWGPADDSPDGYAPNTGQLWRIKPDGAAVTFGPRIRLSEYGQLMGVAVDSQHRVYVGLFNFGTEYYSLTTESPRSGVLRVSEHGIHRVMTLPLLAWPNGLEIHGHSMYVTDSWLGAVWRGVTTRRTAPTQPWLATQVLAPVSSIGANGIAYRHHALYVTAYDSGAVVKIPIRTTGAAGNPRTLALAKRLVAADGVAFDTHGRLWVATNGQYDDNYNLLQQPALVVVNHHGDVAKVATPKGSLDYPTDLVLKYHGGVAVVNGSFVNSVPNVTVFTK